MTLFLGSPDSDWLLESTVALLCVYVCVPSFKAKGSVRPRKHLHELVNGRCEHTQQGEVTFHSDVL